ncbi:MAG: HAMP domain-containing protein, partial [Rhodocyclaceae bacterium]|jgi:serine/threonine protein kinase/HAMP domain-containing protein
MSDTPSPNGGTPPQAHPPTMPGKRTTLPGAGASGNGQVRQAGRYQILELIGRGGMATVYKAHDPGIDRTIAIKFLHASLCEDEQYRGRFLREARAAGMLSHPNIATVHDVGEIEGRPYMAMELLEGDPLNDVMTGGTLFPVREVVEIGIQLSRALDYAHSKGIVHRDIKPANIVRLKGTNVIKVTDFGIAHMASSSMTQHTQMGDVLGTPQYMSPEQTMGQKIDGRSDLFSVGVVLYQLLTGLRPFDADSIVALMLKIAKEEPTPIEKLRNDVPPALRRVVERCLSKQPDRRYQNGAELTEALIKVIREIDEETQHRQRPRIVSLRVKWTALMSLIVAGVMAVTATVVNQRQQAALIGQVTDYGASLSRFIATQSAVSALSEDWVALEVFVQEVMKTQDFHAITVVDRDGIVRAASDAARNGQPYVKPGGETLGVHAGGVAVQRLQADGESVLQFESPITFQGKPIGRVALDIPEKPLTRVARLSLIMMALLVISTIAAVAVATYLVSNWFAKPIRLLRESMAEIGKGRFDHRIAERRNDEFGLLFQAFDDMAGALQQRTGGAPAAAADDAKPTDKSAGKAAAQASPATPPPGSLPRATLAPPDTVPAPDAPSVRKR